MPWDEDPDLRGRNSPLRLIVVTVVLILVFAAVLILVLNR